LSLAEIAGFFNLTIVFFGCGSISIIRSHVRGVVAVLLSCPENAECDLFCCFLNIGGISFSIGWFVLKSNYFANIVLFVFILWSSLRVSKVLFGYFSFFIIRLLADFDELNLIRVLMSSCRFEWLLRILCCISWCSAAFLLRIETTGWINFWWLGP